MGIWKFQRIFLIILIEFAIAIIAKSLTNQGPRKLFGGYRITPKECHASKEANNVGFDANSETICMFNHECTQRGGQVVGACMDGFLFGACCQVPNNFPNHQNTLISDAQNVFYQQQQQQYGEDFGTMPSVTADMDVNSLAVSNYELYELTANSTRNQTMPPQPEDIITINRLPPTRTNPNQVTNSIVEQTVSNNSLNDNESSASYLQQQSILELEPHSTLQTSLANAPQAIELEDKFYYEHTGLSTESQGSNYNRPPQSQVILVDKTVVNNSNYHTPTTGVDAFKKEDYLQNQPSQPNKSVSQTVEEDVNKFVKYTSYPFDSNQQINDSLASASDSNNNYILVHTISNNMDKMNRNNSNEATTISSITTHHVNSIETIIQQLNMSNHPTSYTLIDPQSSADKQNHLNPISSTTKSTITTTNYPNINYHQGYTEKQENLHKLQTIVSTQLPNESNLNEYPSYGIAYPIQIEHEHEPEREQEQLYSPTYPTLQTLVTAANGLLTVQNYNHSQGVPQEIMVSSHTTKVEEALPIFDLKSTIEPISTSIPTAKPTATPLPSPLPMLIDSTFTIPTTAISSPQYTTLNKPNFIIQHSPQLNQINSHKTTASDVPVESTTNRPISISYVSGSTTSSRPIPSNVEYHYSYVPPLLIMEQSSNTFAPTASSAVNLAPSSLTQPVTILANSVSPVKINNRPPSEYNKFKHPTFVKIQQTALQPTEANTILITPKLPTTSPIDDDTKLGNSAADQSISGGYYGSTITQIKTEKLNATNISNYLNNEEGYLPSNDLVNFPPVRNPNLNMSATTSAVTNDFDISTPVFVEDNVLKNKMNTLVNKIVESLQDNFQQLVDMIEESDVRNHTTNSNLAKPSTTHQLSTATTATASKIKLTQKPANPTTTPKTRTTTKKPNNKRPITKATTTTTTTKKPRTTTTTTTKRPIAHRTTRKPNNRRPTKRTTTKTTSTTTIVSINSNIDDDDLNNEDDTNNSNTNQIENEILNENDIPLSSATGSRKLQCGMRPHIKTGRIVGGKGATFGAYPWQVLVRESTWLGLFTKNKCGGVLITNRYVITAAHCQPGFLASLVAVMGEFDISGDLESKRSITKNVKRVIVHRQYDPATFENDIALLELDSLVRFDTHIVPICMPSDKADFTGRMATVTGWGRLRYGGGVPSVLQEVQVPIIENNVCQEMFHTAGHNKKIINSFLCAGYANGQKDSCEGDSGGPLVLQRHDGRYELAGTVSHGIKCASPYLPGVYMRTTYYKPWLRSITGVK